MEPSLSAPDSHPPTSQPAACFGRSLPAQIVRRLARNRVFVAALLVLIALAGIAVLAPLLSARYAPLQPAAQAKGDILVAGAQHLAMIGRTIYAARTTLLFNLLAATSVLLLGIPLGVLAGCRGGWLDALLARLAELVEAFPDLLFLIVFMLGLQRSASGRSLSGLPLLWLGLTLVYGLSTARLARRHAQQIGQAPFILAARNIGISERRIIARHVLPAVLLPMLPAAVFQLQTVVVAETALSYLGLGLPRAAPSGAFFTASWGGMLYEGQQVALEQPLALLAPAACLALLLLCLTALGSGLQRALDEESL